MIAILQQIQSFACYHRACPSDLIFFDVCRAIALMAQYAPAALLFACGKYAAHSHVRGRRMLAHDCNQAHQQRVPDL